MRLSEAFVSLFLLIIFVPITKMVFNLWHHSSIQQELSFERRNALFGKNHLIFIKNIVVEELRTNHEIIWKNIDLLKKPLILPGQLSVDCSNSDRSIIFYDVVLDRPKNYSDNQLRLSIFEKSNQGKRSIACLVARNLHQIKDQKVNYDFTISHITFNNSF